MKVRLDKESVVSLFCYCREAERSVHRAISDSWQDFRAYYGPEKTAPMRRLVERLASAVGVPGDCSAVPTDPRDLGISVWRLFLRICFRRWLVRWEKAWAFPDREVSYIVFYLEELFHILASPVKPEPRRLIALRMALCDCERFIQQRCFGLREIELANGIDHFNKTAWLPRVSLADVLKKSA